MGYSSCETFAPSSRNLGLSQLGEQPPGPPDDPLERLSNLTPEQQYYIEVLSLYSDIADMIPSGEDANCGLEQVNEVIESVEERLKNFGMLSNERINYAKSDGRSPYPNATLDPGNHDIIGEKVVVSDEARREEENNALTKWLEAGLQPGDTYPSESKLGMNGLESFGQTEIDRWLLGAKSLAANAKANPERILKIK